MPIPTEPIGSIPRPPAPVRAFPLGRLGTVVGRAGDQLAD
jgi:hypothetical protein